MSNSQCDFKQKLTYSLSNWPNDASFSSHNVLKQYLPLSKFGADVLVLFVYINIHKYTYIHIDIA